MKDNDKISSILTWLPIGVCIGFGFGTLIGVFSENIFLGMILGIAIGMLGGVGLGILFSMKGNKK